MNEAFGDRIGGEELSADVKALISSTLTTGESVLWAGRPEPGPLVRRSMPKALFGLAFVAFTLVWMTAVVHGRNNNWDHGRAVAPFAPHNVLIATCAGLWFLPPGLFMLTWPLRTLRKARRTVYALTDRRAIVIEPGLLSGMTDRSYPPGALALMRCDEWEDGAGDLVFENRKTWVGMPQAVGFLAVERVREVEAIVRKALLAEGPSTQQTTTIPAEGWPYRISGTFRLYQAVGLAVSGLMAFCLVGNLVVASAALILMRGKALTALAALAAENGWPGPLGVAGCVAIGVGSLVVAGLIAWHSFMLALATPTEIAVTGDGGIELRSWLRTAVLPAGDIMSITTGGWTDPNRFQAVIRHKGGKVTLINQFSEFPDLLATIKALNPAVEIRGF